MPKRNTPYSTLNIQKSTLANLRLLKDVFTGSTGKSISFSDLLLIMLQDTLAQRPEIYANYLKFVTEEDMASLKLIGSLPKKQKKTKEDLGYANVIIEGRRYQLRIFPGTFNKKTGKKREDYCHLPNGKNCGISRLVSEYHAVIKQSVNDTVLGYVSFRDVEGKQKRCPIYQGVGEFGKYCLVDGAKVPYSRLEEQYRLNTEWTSSSIPFNSV